jgi:alpha-2-macroglobulin
MKQFAQFTLLSLISLLLITSCFESRRKIKKINPQFAKYISGYTSGMVSNNQTIRIELADQYDNPGGKDSTKNLFDLPDSSVLDGIFDISPNVKGKAVWLNRRVIEFKPSEPLQPDQFYSVIFKLEKVAKVKGEFSEFEFQFAAYPQRTKVEINGLRTYNSFNTEWMKLSGSISTSDYSNFDDVKKIIEAEIEGNELCIKWDHNRSNTMYYFYIDSIQRKASKQNINIDWNAKVIQSNDKGNFNFVVPAMGDFTVDKARIVDEDDQILELYFTDPLLHRQNLDGIVTINGVDNLSCKVEGNVLRIFIDNRIEGYKEINVSRGIKNYKGFTMNEGYTTSLEFEAPKPKVKLIGQGNILPNSGGLIFPFEAVALKKVDVRVIKIQENNVHQFLQVNELNGRDELSRIGKVIAEKTIDLAYDKTKNLKQWNNHVVDISNLIEPEPGAIYRVSVKFKKEYALCDCSESENEGTPWWERKKEDEWNEDDWNKYAHEDGYGEWHYYNDESSPCSNYYYYGKAVNRNIVASDLGMIYKLDENKKAHAFISNMITTEPVKNCKIEYFDFTKNAIAHGMTDENGMMEVQLKKKPFLMIASYGKQRGYMKLTDANANSLSKFDVNGNLIQKGIKGYIYAERGVWRPGDSIYLNFILEDRINKIPANYPVQMELRNPDGAIISSITRNTSVNGLYDFRTSTSDDAMTGNYSAIVKVGNQMYNKTLKVETVKPNRLKINLDIPEQLFSNTVNDSLGNFEVKWLHGADANSLRMTVDVNFSQIRTAFSNFKDFDFDSPLKQYHSEEIRIFDARLDKYGKAKLTRNFSCGNQASGMLKANFITRVFEEGGDFSIDRFSSLYSPFKNYIGIKVHNQKSNDEYVETNNTHQFDFVNVGENGKIIKNGKVQFKLYKLERRWWYEEESDLSDYVSRNGTVLYADTMLNFEEGHANYKMYFGDDDYGTYLAMATDLLGGHQTGKLIRVDWPYWRRKNRSGNENARMLNFFTDKKEYKTGEKIKISIPSESSGRALISIENSSKILKKFWTKTDDKETRIEVDVTPEMTPNIYIHITMIQEHANTKNDLPIRLYGIVAVDVIDPNTILEPLIVCATSWEPEKIQELSIRERNGQKMSYTLAVVDEGLLDLTRFKTPNPWYSFYSKEAIGVKTWDMYDQVIGAYAGKIDKLLSIGGDEEAISQTEIKANRFKPMVRVLGPFNLEAGKTAKHKIDVPNYVGSVRVMVVAQNQKSYGAAQTAVPVKKPLMVLATLPRVLGPMETVELPVDVFAMENHVRDVKIHIETNDMLNLIGDNNQSTKFTKNGDKIVNFKLKVANKVGLAKVKVVAVSGKEKSEQIIELDVRASNPKVVDSREFVLKPGQSINEAIQYIGIVGTNFTKIEVSNVPNIGFDKRLTELIQYPHGCIEQTTSSVFPQLFVGNVLQIDDNQKNEIMKNVKAGIKRLQKFQTASGGFSYWPGESYTSEWGSNYAGRFIIQAEKKGFVLPGNMKKNWLKYQSLMARNWQNSQFNNLHGDYNNQLIQACRLYTLAEAGEPELGAMNRMRESQNLSNTCLWQLAAAYYLAGQKEVAKQMSAKLNLQVNPYKDLAYAYGSDYRDKALILEVLSVLEINNTETQNLMVQISKELGSQSWLSTQETAYGLLAITKYMGLNGVNESLKIAYQYGNKSEKSKESNKSLMQLNFNELQLQTGEKFTLKNLGKSKLFVNVEVEGVPLIGDQSSTANHIEMTVEYFALNGKKINVSKIQQGTDFKAVVSIKNNGKRGRLDEMTLNQIFPSGWEIRNTRMDGFDNGNQARYQDIRDDRVYSYYDLNYNQSKQFVVYLNASFQGKFYLPTVYSEAMYDQTINARVPGQWVEVVNEKSNLVN